MSLSSPETVESKVNLLGLSQQKLEAFFEEMGEKRFRAAQVLKWIHQMGVDSFDEMTNISKALRAKLSEKAEITAPELIQQFDSADGTRKFLIRVTGGSAIETVFIPDGERGTLCVSSQVGCSLDCSFCSTGKQGFNRDLSAAEIIGQVWIAAKSFGQFGEDRPRKITNVVMMGMGEPLLNFDNVVDSMNLMMHDNCYGISKRRVTLSTSGVVPALDKLDGLTDACLAISLHAPNDELRNELVPINKKYPIAMLLDSAKRYIDNLPDNRRKITIEYTLIDQVNDRPEHARELAQLLRDIPVKINLIPFNPFPMSDYKRVSNNSLRRFQDIMTQEGYITTVRTTRGDDIDAACGQLAGSVNDRTRRSQRYQEQAVRIINNA
ncbi:23S rRNA (adenine(2503)-C(2))-methyltransferase RlmN [Pseudoteredinibacter isoporae]|uniref:Dual-specificity RNA methyltransferase RlmN n=1 Tax=Pseudoteredinibacter isoporae TaxID=570281 RepID=A0A7X0JWT8_9GAMM|nr:23S rRNA (adenine(2503)-C(2))-methyltransferase RlmN [Pseudoteredinibacter isoporae]MBB6523148.1 23S rRNA (adenine2503-C2)-methyltransferase [Pseudoteredinibacter isoporae]NHO88667.1 23S rRNA (adenine(2503)-C(2))-methyltransferase RlmN [Pseudoteredinibacter isoporae]NIB22642.1 23S rRNA (adenine(2503)-C(2))-methyltransferase RlmN [Pseudoteredinibacter isoporae]